VLAYNLGNLWRRFVLPMRIDAWSLTSLKPRLVKTGGRLVKHARYWWLLLAEGHLTRRLFGAMLQRIWALPVPASWPPTGGRISPGRRKGATRDGCPRNINEITRSPPIRRRIASFMMDHPTDDKSSSETCVAGVRSAEVWR
jgi:DDE family transposase